MESMYGTIWRTTNEKAKKAVPVEFYPEKAPAFEVVDEGPS